jgi:hypothetical protein
MQQEAKFSGAEANLVIHQTEDAGKILASVQSHLGIVADRFTATATEGHFKNKILVLRALLSSAEATELASRISSGLSSIDRDLLWRGMDQFSDEKGNLYIRIDKQRLCQGKISVSSADSMRVKFKPVKRYRPASNLEIYRGLFASG